MDTMTPYGQDDSHIISRFYKFKNDFTKELFDTQSETLDKIEKIIKNGELQKHDLEIQLLKEKLELTKMMKEKI